MIDMETEFNLLFLDHRLRNVYKVLNRFHNGECHGTQFQFSAFHLRQIQNVVDQCQQMIAGKTDLPEACPC